MAMFVQKKVRIAHATWTFYTCYYLNLLYHYFFNGHAFIGNDMKNVQSFSR